MQTLDGCILSSLFYNSVRVCVCACVHTHQSLFKKMVIYLIQNQINFIGYSYSSKFNLYDSFLHAFLFNISKEGFAF